MKRKKILCFFGTRPEAIKMAPVVKRLKEDPRFNVHLTVSAQHRQMLDQALKIFGLKSDSDLNVMQEDQSLFEVTSKVLCRFEPILDSFRPDLVLVHGDTTTTLAGTLASYYKKIPVGHVEAGLRSHDIYQPFPEEVNRRMTDTITALNFSPTATSRDNLRREGIDKDKIFVTGNTVIDALLETVKKEIPCQNASLKKTLSQLERKHEKIILMTAHRRENFGAPFRQVLNGVRDLARAVPDMHWIYPVHPNPNVIKPVRQFLSGFGNIHLIPPLGYSDFVNVLVRCWLVVTDSGGLQEEAPSLGKPVLVLRDVTERPEAVQTGTVRLIGPHRNQLKKHVKMLMENQATYKKMANSVNPYGDGRAASRIHQALRWYFGFSKTKPISFRPR